MRAILISCKQTMSSLFKTLFMTPLHSYSTFTGPAILYIASPIGHWQSSWRTWIPSATQFSKGMQPN